MLALYNILACEDGVDDAEPAAAETATEDLCRKVVRLRNQAEFFGFTGVEILRELTPAEMARLFNGLGPEWFPAPARRKLGKIAPDMDAPALVHDVLYALLPATEDAFAWANKTLKVNGYKVADGRYGEWIAFLARWGLKASARLCRNLCDSYGWAAFVAAHEDAKSIFTPERLKTLQSAAAKVMRDSY